MAKEPDIDEFVRLITSPKTDKIYQEPIILDNNEIEEFEEYLKSNKQNSFYVITRLKVFINSFLDEYPEYKQKQYTSDQNTKRCHRLNVNTIDTIIKTGKWDLFTRYTNFEISLLTMNQLISIYHKANEDIFKYFLDHIIDDVHELKDNSDWRLINRICHDCSEDNPATVRCFINKFGGMQHYCTDDKWYPLHQIVSFTDNTELIKFGIDKHIEAGLDLYCENSDGRTILGFIFSHGKENVINYALTKVDQNNTQFKDQIETLLKALKGNNKITSNDRDNFKELLIKN
jgi:hypothetical protein